MYHQYFGLQEAPFSISVDPRYLFMGSRHRDALAHLLFGVSIGGGFILLTGEVGTGKTTLNRCLMDQLPDNTDIALVLNPAFNAIELLAAVCDELGIDYEAGEQSLKVLTDKLHQFLLNNHSNDRNTVLLIDEAQHLGFDVLEQIRLLTNLETNTKKLLQIILVGQPELRTLLAKPELRQLAQRITARYQLKPLNLQETHAYIRHRLSVARLPANQELFPAKVVKHLHKISHGIPRLINILCDRMLLGTYGQNKKVADMAILKQATVEVLGEEDEFNALYSDDNKRAHPLNSLQRLFVAIFGKNNLLRLQLNSILYPGLLITTGIAIAAAGVLAWWKWYYQPLTLAPPTAIVTTQTTPVETTEPEPRLEPWSANKQLALSELLAAQSLTGVDPQQLCGKTSVEIPDEQAIAPKLVCEQHTVAAWQDLQEYNRVAVLTLLTPAKMRVYTTLVALDDNKAVLRHHEGKLTTVPLSELGELWTGDFLFIWQTASHFSKPIGINDRGPMVKWLASRFAELDGQQTLLANNTFNVALTQRVRLFQQEHNLQPDGLVGAQTLLKINDALGISTPLATVTDKTVIEQTLIDTTTDNDNNEQPSLKAEQNTQNMSQEKEG